VVELVEPATRLRTAWHAAHREWGPGTHEDGFGLLTSDDIATTDGFDRWVARLHADRDTTYRWIVENGEVLGAIALRHHLEGTAREVGQLGYGIRPAARRRGLATWAVAQTLELAGTLGLGNVLVVCAEDNTASAHVIEQQGGRLEGIRKTRHGPARRYWITVRPTRTAF
jgi:predicted acetyltransferase